MLSPATAEIVIVQFAGLKLTHNRSQEQLAQFLIVALSVQPLRQRAHREPQQGLSVHNVVVACRELQLLSGVSPFFLSCRTAGELIGLSHDTANVLLKGLCREGILEEIAKGGITARGSLATRWRFVASME